MPLTISNPTRIAAALVFALLSAGAVAQKYTPEPPPLTTGPCKPTKKDPCPPPTPAPAPAANAFPFPGEDSVSPTQQPSATNPSAANTPSSIPLPGEPSASAPTAPGAFPFPGEPEAAPSAAGSSSSSSSDEATDPVQPALKDEGSTGSTRFSRKKLPKVAIVDPDYREAEDLQVSHYYFTTGNFQASYLRAKDATATIPDDPAAHLALAEAARHLNRPEEAVAEYTALLKLDASEEQLKAAHRGLTELASEKPQKSPAK